MTLSNKTLAVAALAGLLSTSFFAVSNAQADDHAGDAEKTTAGEPGKEKHACKGLNSCAGNSPDGKNACKGQSACATDGSK